MSIFNNWGKREGLVYVIVFFWVAMGVLGVFKDASFNQLSIYFGSLTAYAATYIWAETKRPSKKSGVLKAGPNSRREIMIYVVVALWAVTGGLAIWHQKDIGDLALYFVSLTGFIASWIAGEVYQPQDNINK